MPPFGYNIYNIPRQCILILFSLTKDLHNVAKSAQSRIQKLITESDDDEKMETYLQINDLINNTLQKYDDIKAGKTVSKEYVSLVSLSNIDIK